VKPVTRHNVVVGRYAPSPTGRQHLGNLRTALLAWLQVRIVNGIFVLRMEDLDLPRTRPGSAEQILADLRWLGLDWDEGPDVGGPVASYVQSERVELYEEALAKLVQGQHTFACYCSRKDIAEAASAPHGIDGPIYPGTCRDREQADDGKRAAIRCRVGRSRISFTDVVAGSFEFDLGTSVGDFVIKRTDGLFAYQLAVALDDALMGVTDVVRGDDLLNSTPRQIHVQQLLGFEPPRYWHVPLKNDSDGNRLSKRDGSESLAEQQRNGVKADVVVGELAYELGLITINRPLSAAELVAELDEPQFVQALKSAR